MSNQELAEELHKPIIKKFKKRKVNTTFTGNIWGADLADMQLISKFIKGFRFLFVIDIYSKYAWVVPTHYNYYMLISFLYSYTKLISIIECK